MKADMPRTIRALLSHPKWDGWIADKLGNDLFISDPDRASRIHEAAEQGADGSTHAETIEDWREFAADIYREERRKAWNESEEAEATVEDAYSALCAAIDECEQWHISHGTINEQGS